jgi:hypothetical protein
LMGFDEGGVRGKPDNLRLVCQIDPGGKLAVWGREGNRRNIDSVLTAGLPCIVECEFREPNDWGTGFGHTHWVREDQALRVVTE